MSNIRKTVVCTKRYYKNNFVHILPIDKAKLTDFLKFNLKKIFWLNKTNSL